MIDLRKILPRSIRGRIMDMLRWVPDKLYLQLFYFACNGKFINFKHPTLFNDKQNWLKLYDRHDEYRDLADKLAVKRIIDNAIDCKQYEYRYELRNAVRNSYGFNDRTVIGHIGRLTYSKNQFFMLDIFRCFKSRCDNAVLAVVGDGPDATALRDYADSMGISDSAVFLGVRGDIPDILQAMDLFLLPSSYEGLPLSTIEAQAAGLPCLLSDRITNR